jgi:signal transduction histidine kinase
MKLRSHLLALIVVTLVPMVVFGVSATALIAQRERAIFQRGAQQRTLALLTALDTELTGHITSLRGLAGSRSLEVNDLRAFYDEAVRVVPTQPNWRGVNLTLPSGERVFETSRPFGSEGTPVQDRDSFEQSTRTGRPAIGDLVIDEAGHHIPIRLPLFRNDDVVYVLSALVDPNAILALLSPQRLPSDWVGVVLDSNRRIVARTVDYQKLVGQPASDSLQRALDSANEGWFQGSTLEGAEVYTPFNRSHFSGWTVALGIPTAAVDSDAVRATWLLAIGIVTAVGTALLLATVLGRRITRPIKSLAGAALELGGGVPITAPAGSGVSEVNDVRFALMKASNAIREREEALRAADRAKDEFLAMLGHELRNPLAALASAASLLKLSPEKDRRTSSAVAAVGRQVQHMTRLVDDLLDASRATSGKIQLFRQPQNLADVVTATVDTMRSAGRLSQHEVSVEVAPAWVDVDVTRAEQIVSNLIGNAVKYTPPGGRIAVRAFESHREAILQVEDTGVGLSPDLLPRVFDLFVQGNQSLDRSSGGLGIGLTLFKRLTELHGGRVAAESRGTGHGARFTIALPTIQAPDRPAASVETPHAVAAGCRVLLIEDNDDTREMMRAALEHHGYAVFAAPDGPSGIRAAAESSPHVVVVDLGLPGLTGYDVARQLRTLPMHRTTVLIALTGYGQAEARQQAFDAGFDEHLTKPVTPEALARLIDSRLSRGAVS